MLVGTDHVDEEPDQPAFLRRARFQYAICQQDGCALRLPERGLPLPHHLTKGLPPGTDEKLSEQVQPIIEPVVPMCDERKIAVIVVDHDTNRGGTDPAVRRLSPVIMATAIPGSLRRGMSTQALGGSAALGPRSGRPGTTDHPPAGSWKKKKNPGTGLFKRNKIPPKM